MKFVIGAVLVIAINLFTILPLISKTDEEDIGENITRLKKYQWFQDLLSDEANKQLIVHDNDVRRTIGKFKSNKFDNKFFCNKYRNKLQSILNQKSNRLT
ncbi:hypothetical protein [Salimicrobium salexigens]|uniref:Uncharacterized protein n=1 Tax=Salimicrobium salexigens TaxID=908941 RepID=A0ABY1KPF1_9BACI|nr:hypothetical protein [Salimicrobium salexigens]SIS57380.1 hypothetical protein SAMN05421758_102387 [Salimicrobium salexigens]